MGCSGEAFLSSVFEEVSHTLSKRPASQAEGIAKVLRQEHIQLDDGKHLAVA